MKKFILALSIILAISIGLFWHQGVYAQSDPYTPLETAVNQLPADSGVLILLPGNRTISKNPGNEFPAYSVIKLWIAAAVFSDAIEQGNEVDSNTLSLVERMLQNSDNAATNELLVQLGDCSNTVCDPRIMQFAAENGYNRTLIRRRMLETPTPQNDNRTSPEDAVTFMQNLVNKQIINNEVSDQLISILQARTSRGSDPFKPNSPLPVTANFIGKSGILNQGRNDVGTFIDSAGNRIFFAIFVPSGGTGTEQAISNIEQLIYSPQSTPTVLPPSSSQTSFPASQTSISARACLKVGTPTEAKPAICSQPTTQSGASSAYTGQPAPTVEAGQLTQAIKEQFDITMQGGWNEKHLQWIYEKFWELQQTTKFIDYIRGQPIILTGGIPNQETGFVQMSQTGSYSDDREYFLGTLIHEFGHVIYHKPLPQNLRGEVDNLYSRINCVSSYSRCQSNRAENYPEVIAYCLNPKAVGSIHLDKWTQYRDLAVQILGFCYN